MKICTLCKRRRHDKSFNKNSTKSDGLSNICRDCSNERAKERYQQKKTSHKEITKKQKQDRRAKYKERLNEIKSAGCSVCDESDPCCIDFHHKKDKIDNVSTMVGKLCSWGKIEKEIAKCVLLCANCHRKHHAGV